MTVALIVLVIVSCLICGTAADDGDDFANNLLTDLGPLLNLFGERVTMQFMSQSMGWTDNITLAMAPLGIITIIVSAIRVGGPSWLKAMVGRARESRAIQEAELMSSTSEEVCELWNGHEIVRVMGKGPIREFIILPPAKDEIDEKQNFTAQHQAESQVQPNSGSSEVGGRHIADPHITRLTDKHQQYLKEVEGPLPEFTMFIEQLFLFYLPDLSILTKRWKKLRQSHDTPADPEFGSTDTHTNTNTTNNRSTIIIRNTKVSTPNLTLNTSNGPNKWESIGVAIFGMILQSGILFYFGIAGSEFTNDGASVRDYTFPCALVGTALLGYGLIICSHVVEASTKEKTYRPLEKRKARVVWIQRSGTVNDQAFDSFAIFPTDALDLIMTSERASAQNSKSIPAQDFKGEDERLQKLMHMPLRLLGALLGAKRPDEVVAVIGAGVSVCGYVVQFVGFRGTHWSVAIVQLGATVAMTLARVYIRRNLAKTPASEALISGHELDWLSLTLSMKPDTAPWSRRSSADRHRPWRGDGRKGASDNKSGRELWDWKISNIQDKAEDLTLKPYPTLDGKGPGTSKNQANTVMRIRRQLGKLADWRGPASSEAICLARAIEITMDTLFNHATEDYFNNHTKDTDQFTLSWAMPVVGESIHFRIERATRTGPWKTFADELDAALSLWLYYLNDPKGTTLKHTTADKACGGGKDHDDDSWLRAEWIADKSNLCLLGKDSPKLRQNLKFWMPNDAARIFRVKEIRPTGEPDTIIDGEFLGSNEDWKFKRTSRKIDKSRVMGLTTGLIPLKYENDEFEFPVTGQDGQQVEGRDETAILAAVTYGPLKKLLAQYMFSSFMWAAVKLGRPEFSGAEVKNGLMGQKSTSLSLHDAQLSNMAQNIHATGIGSLEEVYLSIIPPLSKWNKFPPLDAVVESIQRHAQSLEKLRYVERAGDVYLWLFAVSRGSDFSDRATALLMEFLRVVKTTLELTENQLLRDSNLKNLSDTILGRLKADRFEAGLSENGHTIYDKLIYLYEKQDRLHSYTEIISHLDLRTLPFNRCLDLGNREIETEDSSDVLGWRPLHYQACTMPRQNNERGIKRWIRRGANVNAQDIRGIAPLHVACWQRIPGIQYILQNGADINLTDVDGRAPLHHAAAHGNIMAIEALVQAGANVNMRDTLGLTPLFWAVYEGYQDMVDDLWSDEHKRLRDNMGRTPLHLAAVGAMISSSNDCAREVARKLEVVQDLLRRGADKEAKDIFGQTPLHLARRSSAIVKLLVDEGAIMDSRDNEDRTTLFLAAEEGYGDVVQLLLERGADKEIGDRKGKTALESATEKGHDDIVQLLV